MSTQPSLGERRPRPRIETLADLVFGLSLSVGAIGLIASSPTTQGEINNHIFAFGFTFLVLTGLMVILAAFAHVISLEEKNLVAPELARLFRNGRNRMVVLSVATAISIAPQFWEWTLFGVPVRLYIWYVPFISYWVGRIISPQSRTYRAS